MPNQMPIPTDWNEEEDGYALYMVCGPNSDQWRRNVKGALYSLTRGRNYDFDTGIFKDIEQYANRMDDSFMACQIDEIVIELQNLVRVGRMINASLHGEAINFTSEPTLPEAINYEGIGPILKSLGAKIDGGMTLDQTIELMQDNDGPDYGFKDWLEILLLLKEIMPDAGSLPFGAIGGLWRSISQARITHNTLTIQAYQATALRGIQNAISPTQSEEAEETFVTGLLKSLDKMPWLTTAIIALVDPSPAGESAMAVKLATAAKSIVTKLFDWLPNWWNSYINTVENPQPQGTIVGMLSEISRKVQSLADETATPTVTVSNRLKAISDAVEGIEVQGVDLTPTLVQIVTALNGIALPEGVTWQALFEGLSETIGDSVPIINVSCGSCGSSSGCGCGGGASGGAYGPGVEGPGDTPPTSLPESGPPNGFPDIPAYDVYKCKAANALVLELAERLYQIAENEDTNFSQYPNYNSVREVIIGKLRQHTLAGIPLSESQINWLADKIMLFVFPYPNEDAIGLAIFEGIRLDYLVDREDAVCELYNSGNTTQARTAIEDRIDGYIDATGYSSDVKTTAKEMYKGLLSNQFLSRLFQKDSFINSYTDASAIDCSLCGEGGDWIVITGESLSANNANPFQVELVTRPTDCANGRQAVINFSQAFKLVNISDLSGYANCGSLYKIYIYNTPGATGDKLYEGNTLPSPETYIGAESMAIIVSDASYPVITITYEWE